MSVLLQTKVGDIKEPGILALIEELEQACPVGARQYAGLPLGLLLDQYVYREGPAKRTPITTQYAAATPLLEAKVGKLPDGALRDLCGELALRAGKALEFFAGSKVYTLLNKAIPKQPAVAKSTEKQRRWDAVVGQRRSNR